MWHSGNEPWGGRARCSARRRRGLRSHIAPARLASVVTSPPTRSTAQRIRRVRQCDPQPVSVGRDEPLLDYSRFLSSRVVRSELKANQDNEIDALVGDALRRLVIGRS